MNSIKIAVSTTTSEKLLVARQLAEKLNLPLLTPMHPTILQDYDYLLLFTKDYLALTNANDSKREPFHLDFLSGKINYRQKQAGFRNELLAKAIGGREKEPLNIIDATAGLGQDSFILATLGFHVTLLERSPVIHALLQDAFSRAELIQTLTPVMQKLNLIEANALQWLPNHQPRAEVIYLDPMFPQKKKSAAAKKEMVMLKSIVGGDEDTEKLFHTALACATRRVVIKRPRLAEYIAAKKPNHSLIGESVRFDVYLT